VPCVKVALTIADSRTRTTDGADTASASTCGRTSDRSHAAPCPDATPHSDQPVNPPSSGRVDGVFAELPLMKNGTPSVRDAWNVPTCAPMNAALLPE
jgi:hypothetical protein